MPILYNLIQKSVQPVSLKKQLRTERLATQDNNQTGWVKTGHKIILIHSANTKSRQVGIIVFAHVVLPSLRPSPLFKSRKTKQQKTMFATGVTMGLAEWIIDDTCLVFFAFFVIIGLQHDILAQVYHH